jgi:hypothetical protein
MLSADLRGRLLTQTSFTYCTMPSAAALTIHLFGPTALAAGIYGLFDPASMATNFSLPTS